MPMTQPVTAVVTVSTLIIKMFYSIAVMQIFTISFSIAVQPIAHSVSMFNENAQECVDSKRRPGICTSLATCPSIIEEYYENTKSISSAVDFQTFVSGSICGFDGNTFLICCRNSKIDGIHSMKYAQIQPTFASVIKQPIQQGDGLNSTSKFYFIPLSPNTPIPTYNTETSTIIHQPTANIYKPQNSTPTRTTDCGISKGVFNRVVGGSEARRGTYPWIAALGYFKNNNRNSKELTFTCGGSLLSSIYVITCAHCINSNLDLVRLGAHDLSNLSEANARNFKIKRTAIHENFDYDTVTNDIALIELNSPAPMTNFILPICLPDSSHFLSQDFVGSHPFIAGWGRVHYQGPTSDVLRDAQVRINDRRQCEQNYKAISNLIKFNEKFLCAGDSNTDACKGDSGGPLMMPQLEDGTYRFYLLGIISFGYECATPEYPGVYTRVASFIPWIRKHMT